LPDCSALPPSAANSNAWAIIIMLALAVCWAAQMRRRCRQQSSCGVASCSWSSASSPQEPRH
jgi:hypothetical protein